ncbi:hypothetical protein F4861DRAFT_504997 [Xylaria intraflava]|nr:hypothetical protein F4861DRAFT_504997 [Xylaria intraflava]
MSLPPPEVLYGPAYPPPPNVIPNLDNPPNQNKLGIAVIILTLGSASICALLRLWSRIIDTTRIGLEDGLGLIGYGFAVACIWSVIDFLQTTGLFVRQWNVRYIDFSHVLYDLYLLQLLYSFAMLFLKTAILHHWIRIFVPKGTRNWFYWIARSIMVANILLYSAAIIVSNLACFPHVKLWQFWVPGRCIDKRNLDLSTSSFNLVFDLCTLLLPQKVIWGLQMDLKRKIGISVIFSIGILACVGAAGRVVSTAMTDYFGEATYGLSAVALFGLMEIACVTIVFCIPAIPKVFVESTLVSRITGSMRSWTRLPRVTQSHFSRDRRTSEESWTKKARKGQPDTSTWSHEDARIPLAQLSSVNTSNNPVTANRNQLGGIMKVTEFSSSDTPPTVATEPNAIKLQHPWMEGDR